jgi:hypothetical protein
MWYRKAQVQPAVDQTAISGYQIGINNILAESGKTFTDIITQLNNYKLSINSNLSIDEQTRNNASALIDTNVNTLTTSSGGNLNAPYTPQQVIPTGVSAEPIDPNNPAARMINQLSGSTLPAGSGGLLGPDQIKQRQLAPPPPPPSGAQGAQQQAAPGKSLYDALKAAGITNFIFEAMPGNTLPLDDRSFEMVKNNLTASKSLNPQAIATLKSLLANMGVYLTLDNNVMIFSKQKTEETPKPQATFDTVPYKDEK